jgi:predicted small lipoprotein YifL
MKSTTLLLLALLTLTACGKRGNPEPPGPASALTYPKMYPTH